MSASPTAASVAYPFRTPRRASTLAFRFRSIERVIERLRESLGEPHTLQSIAELAGMSRFHFNRVFREITGVPPIRFLFALRLERAKHLLLSTDRRVIDICYDVGYSSLGSFGSSFTRLVGVPPSEFRLLSSTLRPADVSAACALLADRSAAGAPGVKGRIVSGRTIGGPVFVGLFASSAPCGMPVACATRSAPGAFEIASVPDGHYFVLAAAPDRLDRPAAFCLLDDCLRARVGPLRVRSGIAREPVDLVLRPPAPTDPPILAAVPLLAAAALAAPRTHPRRVGSPTLSIVRFERPGASSIATDQREGVQHDR